MKKTVALFTALGLLLWFAVPSFAAKKLLGEDELDRITAAGEPTIISIEGVTIEASSVVTTDGGEPASETVTGGDAVLQVSYSDSESAELTLGDNAQSSLRALVLNNVVGENQIGNGINVISGTSGSGTGREGGQSNSITQSWGSVKVTGVTTVTVAESTATETAAEVVQNQTQGQTNAFEDKCVGFSCNTGDQSQVQGDATASTSAATTTAALAIAYPEYMSADLIVHVEDVHISSDVGNAFLVMAIDKVAEASLNLGTGAQSNLAALVVNNVSGKNQVANGINIVGGSIRFASPMDITSGGSGMVASQSNTIQQYRGTPINAPQPVAVAIGGSAAAGNGGAAASQGTIGIAGSQLQIVTVP
jgi:hypothetical protein